MLYRATADGLSDRGRGGHPSGPGVEPMEICEGSRSRFASTADLEEGTHGGIGLRAIRLDEGKRLVVRIGVVMAGLVGLSGPASAYAPHGHGGEPVTFAVVLGLPIIAGLGGGTFDVRQCLAGRSKPAGNRASFVVGILLIVLVVSFAATAAIDNLLLGITGGIVGLISTLWAAGHDERVNRRFHAELTTGAVSVHRLLEGVALGALYSSSAAVGLLAAVVVAGHTAVETAAVGGLSSQYQHHAVEAVGVVQVGYGVGVLTGFGVTRTVPPSVLIGSVALAGGKLIGIGMNETRHLPIVGRLDLRR